MDATAEVIAAAQERAAASAAGDTDRLRDLLHDAFRWVSHAGERFDRDGYVDFATAGEQWGQHELTDFSVVAHPETAVLRCVVVDTADLGHGAREHRMPMTQVWVQRQGRWLCLAGHAGARV